MSNHFFLRLIQIFILLDQNLKKHKKLFNLYLGNLIIKPHIFLVSILPSSSNHAQVRDSVVEFVFLFRSRKINNIFASSPIPPLQGELQPVSYKRYFRCNKLLCSTFSVGYQSITKYRFGRPFRRKYLLAQVLFFFGFSIGRQITPSNQTVLSIFHFLVPEVELVPEKTETKHWGSVISNYRKNTAKTGS